LPIFDSAPMPRPIPMNGVTQKNPQIPRISEAMARPLVPGGCV
jgi:hypothetical protein